MRYPSISCARDNKNVSPINDHKAKRVVIKLTLQVYKLN